MPVRLQIRRGTQGQWFAANPVLAAGELAAETDTNKYKIGDGVTEWNSLPYSSGLKGDTGAAGATGSPGVPGSLLEPSVQQFAADGSILRNLPARVIGAEQLLKQAVWWIDAAHSSATGQAVTNLGWGGSALNAQLGSSGSADSNDPHYLDWDGENYVYLPGVASNFLSVPDEAALDITGDIDIRVRVALDNWLPVTANTLLAKRASSTEISYQLNVLTTGVLRFIFSTDGVTATTVDSTVAPSISDGAVSWVRVTRAKAAGEVAFYTSSDGVAWTQAGSTVTGVSTADLYAGTSALRLGTGGTATNPAAAKVYRAQILNGIDGPPVLDIDCSQIGSGSATSFTALTGQTVTVNRSTGGRKTVAVTHPLWLLGTDDYLEVADNDLIDFGASDSFTVLAVVRQWTTPATDRVLWKGANSSGARYGLNITTTNTAGGILNDGTNSGASTNVTFTYGNLLTLSDSIDRASNNATFQINGANDTTRSISSVGSLANSDPLRVGAPNANSNFADLEFVAAAVFRRALTSSEITTITTYYQGRIG